MKIFKIIGTLLIMLFLARGVQAQDSGVLETKTSTTVKGKEKSLRPLRFGIKVGIPSLITINAEYLTPLLNNRVSIAVDYFNLERDFDGTIVDYSNFEIGSNVYFNPRGKGFYAGLSYTSFDAEGTFQDVEFDGNGENFGDGVANLDYNTFNVKLGLKAGRTIFFRFEVGYGFGSIPQEVTVRSIDDPSLTTVEEIPDLPGLSDSGIIYFNVGLGFGLF